VRAFLVSGGNSAKPLEVMKHALDEVSEGIEFLGDRTLFGPRLGGRDDGLRTSSLDVLEDSVGVVGLVAEKEIEVEAFDERLVHGRVMDLPRRQQEADRLSILIRNGVDFGRYAAF
jgi:hypothetical protein